MTVAITHLELSVADLREAAARKLSFRRLSVRPQHPLGKSEEQAVFSAVSAIS